MVVLVAVGEKHDAKPVIDTAYELAMAYEDELQVLHVIPREDAEAHFEALREIPDFRDFSFDVEHERAAEIADRLAEAALGDPDHDGVTPIGRVGDPTEEILATADRLDPRYVVVGGRKRSPAGKAVFGSVTQPVILNSTRPVVTVMTDD